MGCRYQTERDRAADSLGWWTLSGQALMDALHRVKDGDDPDVVYAELYANCEHEDYRE